MVFTVSFRLITILRPIPTTHLFLDRLHSWLSYKSSSPSSLSQAPVFFNGLHSVAIIRYTATWFRNRPNQPRWPHSTFPVSRFGRPSFRRSQQLVIVYLLVQYLQQYSEQSATTRIMQGHGARSRPVFFKAIAPYVAWPGFATHNEEGWCDGMRCRSRPLCRCR